jgi:hypothetical protein
MVPCIYLDSQVHLELLAQRAQQRAHFMPPSLLPSQLAALEEPDPATEPCFTVDGSETPGAVISELLLALCTHATERIVEIIITNGCMWKQHPTPLTRLKARGEPCAACNPAYKALSIIAIHRIHIVSQS